MKNQYKVAAVLGAVVLVAVPFSVQYFMDSPEGSTVENTQNPSVLTVADVVFKDAVTETKDAITEGRDTTEDRGELTLAEMEALEREELERNNYVDPIAEYLANDEGISIEEASKKLQKLALSNDLAGRFEEEYPDTMTSVWVDDNNDINVAANSQETLDELIKLEEVDHVHLYKYSYKDIEKYAERITSKMADLNMEDYAWIAISARESIISVEIMTNGLEEQNLTFDEVKKAIQTVEMPGDILVDVEESTLEDLYLLDEE